MTLIKIKPKKKHVKKIIIINNQKIEPNITKSKSYDLVLELQLWQTGLAWSVRKEFG